MSVAFVTSPYEQQAEVEGNGKDNGKDNYQHCLEGK